MKNKNVLLLLFCIISFTFITIALIPRESFAYDVGDTVDITPIIEEALDGTDLSPWQKFVSGNELFADITDNSQSVPEYLKKLIKGEAVLSFDGFINALFSRFISSVKSHMGLAAILLGIALICTVLEKFSKSIFKGSISSAASGVLFFSAVGLIIKGFAETTATCTDCINNMSDFTDKTLPILMTFVTAVGNSSSSGILQPGILMILELTVKLINCIIIPLLTASAVLSTAYNICQQKPYANISGSVKKLADWIIGIMFTLFFGFISIQKLTASALDGACIKTIKYTLSSFSLYGGSFLSKSFDIVTGCAVIMKNVLGGTGMIILLSICVSPALELLAVSVVYRISSLFISLTGETRISGCLNDIGKIYGTMFLCIMTSAVLFFMLLSVITAAGNTLAGI